MEQTEKDTPPAHAADRIAKYFRLDRAIVKRLKVYAAEHEMKEVQVIEKALLLLFESE